MRNLFRWKVVIDKPFLHCANIFPAQQAKVKELLASTEGNTNIRRIIIFGSSTSPRCHIGSDLDAYFVLDRDEYPIARSLSFPCDLWTNYTADDTLKNEIREHGVLVYERS